MSRIQDTRLLCAIAGLVLLECHRSTPSPSPLDVEAQKYVLLAVALGERDPDALDYYIGPSEAVAEIREHPPAVNRIRAEALAAIGRLESQSGVTGSGEMRRQFLLGQLRALAARADLLLGVKRTFDNEAEAFFGVRPPASYPPPPGVRAELQRLLGGKVPLAQAYAVYDAGFIVPPDRLPAVMAKALELCRQETLAHLRLPATEQVALKYVYNKPWSAYSYYKGNYRSEIHINTDFALTVDRAFRLACHEAYPGHHTFNTLVEQSLVRGMRRGEFTVQPVFSPQSLISEGTATLAIDIAFTEAERARLEQDMLFPLAGIRNGDAVRYVHIQRLVNALHPAELTVARDYADEKLEFVRAGYALREQALMSGSDAALKYVNEFRSQVVTYTQGQDLVKAWMDRTGAPAERWKLLVKLATGQDSFRLSHPD